MTNDVIRKAFVDYINILFFLTGVGSVITISVISAIDYTFTLFVLLPVFFINGFFAYVVVLLINKLLKVLKNE